MTNQEALEGLLKLADEVGKKPERNELDRLVLFAVTLLEMVVIPVAQFSLTGDRKLLQTLYEDRRVAIFSVRQLMECLENMERN